MLKTFVVLSDLGSRSWQAEDEAHAIEQHEDAFPDEPVLEVMYLPSFPMDEEKEDDS